MPSTTSEPELDTTRPFRIRWTRTDCERFERDGLLTPGKYELIEGDILRKMPQKRPHAIALSLTCICLRQVFGDLYVEGPVAINVAPEDNPTSEPEPDLIVLSRPLTAFSETNPRPEDIRLLIEVSDATRYFDRGIKANLYARAGIVEYWSLDLVQRTLHVHREPSEGKYQRVSVYQENETIAPLAAVGQTILVSALLPPRTTE
ncbi:Uma2 family endonuclease [Armatimonas rosea]|uniref:Uma2 family endonuclease n=1 Tax=Armatimonas rosea TaxID=685828 RepID=A0A7W9ST46_ARMRO|nr:Uma2 family endonuclease [Armatimonas rosea]MBB6052206.1 Uma2 family endonuclease [Armatimonas rosea]